MFQLILIKLKSTFVNYNYKMQKWFANFMPNLWKQRFFSFQQKWTWVLKCIFSNCNFSYKSCKCRTLYLSFEPMRRWTILLLFFSTCPFAFCDVMVGWEILFQIWKSGSKIIFKPHLKILWPRFCSVNFVQPLFLCVLHFKIKLLWHFLWHSVTTTITSSTIAMGASEEMDTSTTDVIVDQKR